MKNEAFVKVYRSLKDSELWKCEGSGVLKTYIALILHCNYEDHMYRNYKVHIGEWIGSKKTLEGITGTSRTQLNNHLDILKSYGILVIRQIDYKGMWLITLSDYVSEKVLKNRIENNTENNTRNNTQNDTENHTHYKKEEEKKEEINNTSTYDDEEYEEVIIDGVVKYKDKDGEIWDV